MALNLGSTLDEVVRFAEDHLGAVGKLVELVPRLEQLVSDVEAALGRKTSPAPDTAAALPSEPVNQTEHIAAQDNPPPAETAPSEASSATGTSTAPPPPWQPGS